MSLHVFVAIATARGTLTCKPKRTPYVPMATEEVIKVEWEQLPQRSLWRAASSMGGAKMGDKLGNVANCAPRTSDTPAGKQAGHWEYLDHTADVQIHSWGADIKEAFGAAVVGMFGYMVELDEISHDLEMEVVVSGHNKETLLFNFMQECLYIFLTESFVMKEIVVNELVEAHGSVEDFDTDKYRLSATAKGGSFDATRHSQGTEVKAVTYSNLQIVEGGKDKVETFVIVDI